MEYAQQLYDAQLPGQRVSKLMLRAVIAMSGLLKGVGPKMLIIYMQVSPLYTNTLGHPQDNPEAYSIGCSAPLVSFKVLLAFLRAVGVRWEQVLVLEVQQQPSEWSEMDPWWIRQSRRINQRLLAIALSIGAINPLTPLLAAGTFWAGADAERLRREGGLTGLWAACYHPSPAHVSWLWRALSCLWCLRHLLGGEPLARAPLEQLFWRVHQEWWRGNARGLERNELSGDLLRATQVAQATGDASAPTGWRSVITPTSRLYTHTNPVRVRGCGSPLDEGVAWVNRRAWVVGTVEYNNAWALHVSRDAERVETSGNIRRKRACAIALLSVAPAVAARPVSAPVSAPRQRDSGHRTHTPPQPLHEQRQRQSVLLRDACAAAATARVPPAQVLPQPQQQAPRNALAVKPRAVMIDISGD